MAITPGEAKRLSSQDESEVNRIETELDKGLSNEERTFEVEIKNEKVKNRIVSLYQTNGWVVTWSKKSDGKYKLVFSEYSTHDYYGR